MEHERLALAAEERRWHIGVEVGGATKPPSTLDHLIAQG
jgi:hypothetical protein